jgi:LPS sulfotransferase NodH
MIDIPKWPVLIVATPRSGSTELAFQIWKNINSARYPGENITTEASLSHLQDAVTCFIEPDKHEHDAIKLENMLVTGNTNYIAKFIVHSVGKDEQLDSLLKSDCFKIKLDRLSLEDQAISLYIADVTGRWDQHTATVDTFEVPISIEKIHRCVNVIKREKAHLQSLTTEFDITLTYEDLDFSSPVDCFKNSTPKNINQLRDKVRRFI